MTTRLAKTNPGLTLTEVLALVAVLAVVGFLLLPSLGSPKCHRPKASACLSNLKQTSLGAWLFANDHDGKFPWEMPLSRHGTRELSGSPEVFRHFISMTNELNTPKILICPTDRQRKALEIFSGFSNSNLSYFLNLAAEASTNEAVIPMFGDRNVTGGSLSNGFLRTFSSIKEIGWTKELHEGFGHFGMADGSAMRASPNELDEFASTSRESIRLAIPR
jgi:hypothetical protein